MIYQTIRMCCCALGHVWHRMRDFLIHLFSFVWMGEKQKNLSLVMCHFSFTWGKWFLSPPPWVKNFFYPSLGVGESIFLLRLKRMMWHFSPTTQIRNEGFLWSIVMSNETKKVTWRIPHPFSCVKHAQGEWWTTQWTPLNKNLCFLFAWVANIR